MPQLQVTDSEIFEILWASLKGGRYDLEKLKRTVSSETELGDILDSLDVIDFVLRLEHHYKIRIPQADFPQLSSIAAIAAYVGDKSKAAAAEPAEAYSGSQP